MNRIVKSRSWATQRLANYFPPWSRARTDEFSITQQLLHPIGNSLEEAFTQLARASRNNFVESSDINQICISDYYILPRGFPIVRDNIDEVNLRYREPTCSGYYLDFEDVSTPVDILALDLNSAEG
ncbi:hypothetical protein LRR18_16605, partial [Mangrovimonas sp. AS39]|uniref:hypothetical protein n=1 Tax=Mangrovimonas futianensis TaxID=2895523 RepID=UPI001E652BC9